VFAPAVAELYPTYPPVTTVQVAGLTDGLCGASRPGHFDGVTTIVAKLFSIVGTSNAYFGRKDAQQLAVVKRMTADLALPVTVIGCPLVREADGLAKSSRNAYLTVGDRRAALAISRGLRTATNAIVDGERDAHSIRAQLVDSIASEPGLQLDYAEVCDAGTVAPIDRIESETLIAVAAFCGSTRLIDNATIRVDGVQVTVDLGTGWVPDQHHP
jgi:pantoate--beta-alanine ligase